MRQADCNRKKKLQQNIRNSSSDISQATVQKKNRWGISRLVSRRIFFDANKRFRWKSILIHQRKASSWFISSPGPDKNLLLTFLQNISFRERAVRRPRRSSFWSAQNKSSDCRSFPKIKNLLKRCGEASAIDCLCNLLFKLFSRNV